MNEELKKQEKKDTKFQMTVSKNQERTNTIKWIEKGILEHPLSDHRRYVIWKASKRELERKDLEVG
jgi:hypothetical protein